MTRTWRSTKARFKPARISASIGRLKSRPVTSAPVWSVKGAIVNERIDESRVNLPDAIAVRRQDQYVSDSTQQRLSAAMTSKTNRKLSYLTGNKTSNKQQTNNYQQS